jgi:hypothetical protein
MVGSFASVWYRFELLRLLPPVGRYELIANTGMFIGVICLNVLFFRKRKTFPRYAIIYLVASFALSVIDWILVDAGNRGTSNDDQVVFSTVRAFLGAVIWTRYLLVSRRVEATFTR